MENDFKELGVDRRVISKSVLLRQEEVDDLIWLATGFSGALL
jgi:hypothetical protein